MPDREPRHDTQAFRLPAAVDAKTVLLVDDDEAIVRGLRRVLMTAGYDVFTAGDGAAAIEAIKQRSFGVIVSDIQMPRMSGVELLSVVRAYDLDVPFILLTGNPSLETAMEAISLGAMQYLVKPLHNDEFLKIVERASRLHRMAGIKRDALKLLGETETQAGDRAGLRAGFDNALETMWVAFQPIVDAPRRRVYAYEALLRCNEPSLPHPGAVLEAAERLGRLPDLGRRVRSLAAKAFERAPCDALLFVNLHTRDLLDQALYEQSDPLRRFADRVVLEITERAAIDDVKDIRARTSVLRYHGYRLAIDDLGAGYAGLSSFVALEPEFVKLDMSIVRGVHQSQVRKRLVASMTSLSNELGLRVVAEGVEVVEERDCIREFGCDLMQGYLFAKPGPPFPSVGAMA